MHVAMDIDGTIGAAPAQCQELASALMAAGHRVSIITGSGDNTVSQNEFNEKANYLNALGMGESYDDMVVISNKVSGGLANAKAQWCKSNGVDLFIDNNSDNCQAAVDIGIPLALLPWATQV